jgi:membrane protease subunit (stomatin/prohibitin family)
MGLIDRLKGEFIDIIEWLDSSTDTMCYRFERYGNEIKFGAKLVVREGQAAVFINEGKLADVFAPGTHMLETKNVPLLSTLQGWPYGFHSPFKAEVYFVNTRNLTDLKWGTKNPVMLRDAEFGPVRVRAFGSYSMRVADPAVFIREIVGTDGDFTADKVTEQLRNIVVARTCDAIAESRIPVLDLAANYDELGRLLHEKIGPEFGQYGLALTKLLVENISLPPEVEKAMDKRSAMGIVGNLQNYAQFQAANAMEEAAKNPGGAAGGGMGMGMGFVMAGQMGQTMQGAGAPQTPPPLPQTVAFFAALGGVQAGPFDLEALRGKVAGGEVTRETQVWKQGMVSWTAAGQVQELSALFANQPPPIPKP